MYSFLNFLSFVFNTLECDYLCQINNARKRIRIVKAESDADYVITNYRWNLKDYGAGEKGYALFYQLDVDGEAVISAFKR